MENELYEIVLVRGIENVFEYKSSIIPTVNDIIVIKETTNGLIEEFQSFRLASGLNIEIKNFTVKERRLPANDLKRIVLIGDFEIN